MKYAAMVAGLAVAIAAGSYVWAEHHGDHAHGEKAGWFDVEHCDVCAPMSKDPELMSSLQWETHKVKSGMLMVSIIPEEHRKTFDAMCEQMQAKGKEIAASGKEADLCGFCDSYGKILRAGAEEEIVKTGFGNVSLVTAKSPEAVKMIHEHAQRSQEEMKKMMAEMMSQAGAN